MVNRKSSNRQWLLALLILALVACDKRPAEADYPRTIVRQAQFTPTLDSIVITMAHEVTLRADLSDNGKISLYPSVDYRISARENEIVLVLDKPLKYFTTYTLKIEEGDMLGVHLIDNFTYKLNTPYDPTPKFPKISDDELLTLVQRETFRYFYDFAHPTSGLARERDQSGNTVTTGGSGFGLAAFPVAVERGFITRQEAIAHCTKVVDFLTDKAERFHGAYSHWLDGNTGKAIAFSTKDNGADLVETAFLMEGLLVLRQYFSANTPEEIALREKITAIWEGVEWTWFQQNGQNVLYWHWSPNYGWDMNMRISGWNEAMIIYVLAASSPTYPIERKVYTEGWTRNGAFRNGRKFAGITLPLGSDWGGPMFFAHYSFLGLNPMHLQDEFAHYGEQNTAHARINYTYSLTHREQPADTTQAHWGLTASDLPRGYGATSPTNDNGTTAPTAALASMPYTPKESMAALRYFYYTVGDRLWGKYGFKDAFNLDSHWFAGTYLAIDQGPIIVMIENYRTGLAWNLMMQDQDVQNGLQRLEISHN